MSAGVPPTGVVTFLFTDIEGSTRRWESDADAMRVALACHDKVLRSAIETHDGFVFSHSGDGLAAAFASPTAAVEAAVDAQRELELPVRMGIATGEAEVRDGDYFGTVLNRAARVMAAGHGGQILVAESTAVLLSGVDLVNLGPQRLRDVSVPVTLFQVHAQGLQTAFPAPRTVDASHGNLRAHTTSFIGRESELLDVQNAIRANRLVTLTGMGGVGKTRLGFEVAGRMIDEFPDGIWVFELAAVSDPSAVPDAMAAVLGVTQQPGRTVTQTMAAAQEGRNRLWVIDNCEHVLDAAAEVVEAVLTQSTTVRILATSREGLGVESEHIWPVPALAVDAGAESPAATLFAERARAAAPHFSMRDEADAVAEICGRLDGIPLAIELAGSRMASMTATEVRDRLDHRFRLLVGSRRGSRRHQTLRHAVAWSFDLLSEKEKSILVRCSVFTGGFDLESACAVAGFDEADDYAVLDGLDALVRKSLLVADRSAKRIRYHMLETIRQFAAEELAISAEATEVRIAHARYFAQRVADITALWDSPRQREAYDWLFKELANLRTAFRLSSGRNDLDTAATIATHAALIGFCVANYEPVAWTEELIGPANDIDHPLLPHLCVTASVCWMAGRIEEAFEYDRLGRAILEKNRNPLPYGIENWLGAANLAVGEAGKWAESCRAQLERRQDANVFIRGSEIFGLVFSGAYDRAIRAANGLVEDAEGTHNPFMVSFALSAYGFAISTTDPARAITVLRRSLEIARDNGVRFNESIPAVGLARLEIEQGDMSSALDHITLAIRSYHDSGNTSSICTPLAILASLFGRLERYEPAAVISGFAGNPLALSVIPEFEAVTDSLRDALGEGTYEALADTGKALTTAEIAAYAYDQIARLRAELDQSS
ncbi:adenylate/guanylate cyclase domain-containing protein [Mycobacterium sp. GA-1199]|uniref:ATP-binding protein n=1 Tax=Mycobacterium sp. GA-1199 TaxID=1772287 RepID=UPI000AF1BB9A|nr:adenylate/guanylate cyclase domain-containing protein [Mycobacterium sp. GA-1199]